MYTLAILWQFSDTEIQQILNHFQEPIQNNENDRLNAVLLSYNHGLLDPSESHYVTSPYFNQLFTTSDIVLNQHYGTTLRDHIQIIKYVIDQLDQTASTPIAPTRTTSTPIAPTRTTSTSIAPTRMTPTPIAPTRTTPTSIAPTRTTSTPIAPTRMTPTPTGSMLGAGQVMGDITLSRYADAIAVCGKGTFPIKDSLKKIGATWDGLSKCWLVPIGREAELMQLLPRRVEVSAAEAATIPDSIPKITAVPKRHQGLRIYQMEGQILLCGKTAPIQRDLQRLNATYDTGSRCWIAHPRAAVELLQLVQAEQTKLINEDLRRQSEKRHAELEQQQRLQRLQIPEQEATFISYSQRQFGLSARDAQSLDRKELEPIWRDQIQVLQETSGHGNKVGIVTYTGHIKPPDAALAFAVDYWHPFNFGYTVKRIDYKTYEVTVFTD